MNFDEVHGIFEELFGSRIILPDYKIEDIDEPAVLDCGFGKGQWLEAILEHTDSDAWVSQPHMLHLSASNARGIEVAAAVLQPAWSAAID